MSFTDVYGHIGYLYIALGMWLLSKKDIVGWIYRFLGELIWIIIGFHIQMTSIWLWGIVFMVIDLTGFFKWRKYNEQN